MAFINFDCPECGHNLEVDERGAGFIVKCPECNNPLQIPEIPHERKRRKQWISALTILVAVGLLATNLGLWWYANQMKTQAEEIPALKEVIEQMAAQQLQSKADEADTAGIDAVPATMSETTLPVAVEAMADEMMELHRQLTIANQNLLTLDPNMRTALLRKRMRDVVNMAKEDIPAPQLKDTTPDKGIQGQIITFPELLSNTGTVLHTNATVTAVKGEDVSVQFEGGAATYKLAALHPGIAAYLPMDPLFALPQNQWSTEVRRIQELESTQREQHLQELRQQAMQPILP